MSKLVKITKGVPTKKTYLYFGYGSNLNYKDLSKFCRGRKHYMRSLGKASLVDYTLSFNYYSPSRGGGALNLVERVGSVVDGVVFEVDIDMVHILDAKEGAGWGYYDRVEVVIEGPDGPATCFTYMSKGHKTFIPAKEFYTPTKEYVDIVAKGYVAHGLSLKPLKRAAKDDPTCCEVSSVFVYGSLMTGMHNHSVIAEVSSVTPEPAKIHGKLFSLGSYPCISIQEETSCTVLGEMYSCEDIRTALSSLDSLEGFKSTGSARNYYERSVVPVIVGNGEATRAWVYSRYDVDCEGLPKIPSGNWRSFKAPKLPEYLTTVSYYSNKPVVLYK